MWRACSYIVTIYVVSRETKVQLKPFVEKAMELFAFFIQLLLK